MDFEVLRLYRSSQIPEWTTPSNLLSKLSVEEKNFYKSQTTIADDGELEAHVQGILENVCRLEPQIDMDAFARLTMTQSHIYPYVVQLGIERPGAVLLDIGCGIGKDVRKVLADGFPDVVATDVNQDLWDFGHRMFRSTPESCRIYFIQGNIFDTNHLALKEIQYQAPAITHPRLSTIRSLTPLLNQLSVIHVGNLFHLFDEVQQLDLARRVGSLLCAVKGCVIFGQQFGLRAPGIVVREGSTTQMFCHSPQSWTAMWEGQVFSKAAVCCKANLVTQNGNILSDQWRARDRGRGKHCAGEADAMELEEELPTMSARARGKQRYRGIEATGAIEVDVEMAEVRGNSGDESAESEELTLVWSVMRIK